MTLARLKGLLVPVVRLDYAAHEIFLHADSELMLWRARACAKEPETVQWIESSVHSGEVFYDVGANIGAYSLVAAKYLHDQVRVLAFEPSFSTYSELCRNVVLNRCEGCIEPHMIALTEQSGTVEFEYRSLAAGAAEHAMTSAAQTSGSDFEPVYKQKLLAFSLDDLVGQYGFPVPDSMKIDVDGAESAILRGAAKTLREPNLRSLLVEVHADQLEELVGLLEAAGFEATSRHDRGNGLVWNIVFCR